jgi:hypothetical protein
MIFNRDFKNQRGQTLVNALMGIAIAGILSVTVASILATQARETRALGEKMASLDLQRTMISTLANSMACNALFTPVNLSTKAPNNGGGGGVVGGVVSGVVRIVGSALTFDLTLIDPKNPLVFALEKVPSIGGGPAIISAGEKVSPMSNNLYLLPSTAPMPGIQMIVTSASTAILRLNFDPSKLVHPIRSLEFPLNIQTSGNPTQTTIQGCSNTMSPSQWQCLSMGGDWFTPGSLNCVRVSDGTSCKLGSSSNGFFGNHIRSSNWNCVSAGANWPGGGPWACSVASASGMMIGMPNGQPACVRTSDGMLCTLTSHFDFWGRSSSTPKWKCITGGGWPL